MRRAVAELAKGCDLRGGEAELVATELGTNLVKHAAPGGYVLYRETGDGIEFLSVDNGPGIASRGARAAGDSAARPGDTGLSMGLASIQRIVTDYDCYSNTGGTVLLARLAGRRRLSSDGWRHGGVNIPLGDTGPSGDAWAVHVDRRRLAALVVDGLGHGEEAAVAAWVAVDLFDRSPVADPEGFIDRAHEAMWRTRGAVAGVCVIDPDAGRLTFAGIGNISGLVMLGGEKQDLVSNPGTLGTNLSALRVRVRHYRWAPGATLVLSSDGIRAGWRLSAYPGLLSHDPAVIAAVIHRDFTRSTDDATVLVVRDLA